MSKQTIKPDSKGDPAGRVVAEIYTHGNSSDRNIEALSSGSTASRQWSSGDRPRLAILMITPSNPAETEVAVANARVHVYYDAASDVIGEALATPQPAQTGRIPYKTYKVGGEPIEVFFPKSDTYDGLSRISCYADGVAVDINIQGVV